MFFCCGWTFLQIGAVGYDRAKVAAHATNLASTIQKNLEKSLVGLGVDILIGHGKILAPHKARHVVVSINKTSTF